MTMKVFDKQINEQGYLTGVIARETLDNILADAIPIGNDVKYPEPFVCGYFKDENKWIAFDNKDGCCWTEEYDTEREAMEYLGITIELANISVDQHVKHIDYIDERNSYNYVKVTGEGNDTDGKMFEFEYTYESTIDNGGGGHTVTSDEISDERLQEIENYMNDEYDYNYYTGE